MPGATVSAQVANEAYAVTPSNTLPNCYSYLYVGGAGDLVLVPENGTTAVTLSSVPGGSWIWIRTSLVKASGTSATNIVGFK